MRPSIGYAGGEFFSSAQITNRKGGHDDPGSLESSYGYFAAYPGTAPGGKSFAVRGLEFFVVGLSARVSPGGQAASY